MEEENRNPELDMLLKGIGCPEDCIGSGPDAVCRWLREEKRLSVEPFYKYDGTYGCEIKPMSLDKPESINIVQGDDWAQAQILGIFRAVTIIKSGEPVPCGWKPSDGGAMDADTVMLARGLGFPPAADCNAMNLLEFIDVVHRQRLDVLSCTSAGGKGVYSWVCKTPGRDYLPDGAGVWDTRMEALRDGLCRTVRRLSAQDREIVLNV